MSKILTIKEIQTSLFEMGKEICRLLEKEKLPYSIIDGTLLGAVRHNDFIPWDDDFDILIFDEYYDETCKVLRNKLPEKYFFEDENSEPLYFHAWPHVKDKGTLVELKGKHQDSIYTCQGLAVDLYRAKKIRERELANYLRQEDIAYRKRLYNAGIIDKKNLEQLLAEVEKKKINNTGGCEFGYGRITKFVTPFIKEEEMFPLKKYTFRNVQFWGPNYSESILKRSYGNYMELPPIEKRVSAYLKVEELSK